MSTDNISQWVSAVNVCNKSLPWWLLSQIKLIKREVEGNSEYVGIFRQVI